MQTLQMVIEHLLRAEQQTHDARERIYHAVSSGRQNVASGFTELLSNDRHGTALRMGYLVGYASAFRMHSNFITQARNTYGGHELAEYYHGEHLRGPRSGLHPDAAAYAEYLSRIRNADYAPDDLSHTASQGRRASPVRDENPLHRQRMTDRGRTFYQDDEVATFRAAATSSQVGANGHHDSATNGLNGTHGVGSSPDTVIYNGNGIANGIGASRDTVPHITSQPIDFTGSSPPSVPEDGKSDRGESR